MQGDLALHDTSRLGHDAQDRAGGDRLAAAAFAHDAQRLTVPYVKINPIHRARGPLIQEEVSLKILDFQEQLLIVHKGHS